MSELSPRTIRHKATVLRNAGAGHADHCAAKADLLAACADRIESLESSNGSLRAQVAKLEANPPRVDAGPVPAPPEAGGVTLEDFDGALAEFRAGVTVLAQKKHSFMPLVAACGLLETLRPLVEEAEAKRRIGRAGFRWETSYTGRIQLWRKHCSEPTDDFTTWAAARDWAEAQAAKGGPKRQHGDCRWANAPCDDKLINAGAENCEYWEEAPTP